LNECAKNEEQGARAEKGRGVKEYKGREQKLRERNVLCCMVGIKEKRMRDEK
jgi:hypothetical protein